MQGKVLPERSATQVYVGIDVCKAKLDVYIHPLGLRYAFANDAQGIKRLKRCLEAYDVARVVMEATGKLGLSGISCASGADIFSGDHRL